MYLRNIKKGFATNSSSYHTTITGYITVPTEIWLNFKNSNVTKVASYGDGEVLHSIALKDDEGRVWYSYSKMREECDIYEKKIDDKYTMVSLEYEVEDY